MPLAQANEKVCRALANLEHDTDFLEVVDWLERSKTGTVEMIGVQHDDVKLRWAQADLLLLTGMLDLIATARRKVATKSATAPQRAFTG